MQAKPSRLHNERVLLIVPPEIYFKQEKYSTAPLHLIQLAPVLQKNGFDVKIIDGVAESLKLGAVKDIIREYAAATVGITSTTWNRFDAFKVARGVKQIHPDAFVIYGGPHATFTAEDTLTNIPWIDQVAVGEGEETLLALCMARSKGHDTADIAGSYCRRGGKILSGGNRPLIADLNTLPFPSYSLVPLHKYKQDLLPGSPLKAVTMVTSRGCPLNCSFCSVKAMWGKSYRYKNAERTCDEIQTLLTDYGYEGIWFYDDTFTLHKKRVLLLLEEIKKRKLSFSWFAETRVDCVDYDLLKQMKEAGCRYVAFGIESVNQKVLDTIQKQITVEEIKTRLMFCKDLGIRVKAFFIFGSLDETYEETMETVKFIRDSKDLIQDRAVNGLTRILPGTDVEKIAKERGYFPKNFCWSKFYYNAKNLSLGRSPFIPPLIQPHMGYKELLRLKYELLGREHYPFRRLLSKLTEIKSLSGVKKLLFNGVEYLKWRFGY